MKAHPASVRNSTVAAVAFAFVRFVRGVLAPISGKAAADIVGFLELALPVAAHETLVGPGVDQFARHMAAPFLWLNSSD
jgi:hypothetical protein